MEILMTSIQSIVPIIAIIVLGYFLQTHGWFGQEFGQNLSRLIMNIALPASIFVSVMKYLTFDKLISLSEGLVYTFAAFIYCSQSISCKTRAQGDYDKYLCKC